MAHEFFEGFLDDYFAECEEHLVAARATLLSLEASAGQPAAERGLVDDLFRFFHSLKGISAMVELRSAERLSHELENFLRPIRAGELQVTGPAVNLLIEGTQLLERVIDAHRAKDQPPPIDEVIQRIAHAIPSSQRESHVDMPPGTAQGTTADAPATGARLWKCTFAPTHELLARGIGVDAARKRLAEVGTIVEAAPLVKADGSIAFEFTLRTAPAVDAQAVLQGEPIGVEPIDGGAMASSAPTAGSGEEAEAMGTGNAAPSQIVRVDLAKLDELMRHVGDLVISRARLLDTLSRIEHYVPGVEWRAVQENALSIDRQLRTLRDGLMRVRLVPIGEIFRRMPFVVRDLARETGKKVIVLLHGQTTEIDKYLIERMMDPVLHLVRNAVSHGIEPPDERIRHGKRPEGTITLNASAAGELVTIEIRTMGEVWTRRMLWRGLVTPAFT